MKKATVTSGEIKQALALKHHREFFLAECKSGPTQLGSGLKILDGLAIYKSWTNPRLVGYEIKISRSDFLGDAKFYTYLPLVHELYIVTPKGLIDRTELPDSIGLMYYNPDSGAITTRKKAIHRKIEVSSDLLMYVIMNRLESDRHPFHDTKADYWRDWVENKTNNRELGRLVGSKLLEQLKEKERELSRYEHFKLEFDNWRDVQKVLEEHGISTFYHSADELRKALGHGCPHEIEQIDRQVGYVVNLINRIKKSYGEEEEKA